MDIAMQRRQVAIRTVSDHDQSAAAIGRADSVTDTGDGARARARHARTMASDVRAARLLVRHELQATDHAA
jgi:hypothetical protein